MFLIINYYEKEKNEVGMTDDRTERRRLLWLELS